MFKLLGTAVIFTFLCVDRNWEILEKALETCSQFALLATMVETVSCESYDIPVKEDFTMGNYRYEVSLPQYNGNFSVTIKYRAMMIIGHEPRLKQCDLVYFTVTTLPEYVDTSRAVWSFEFGTLVVMIPAKQAGSLDLNEIDFSRFGCYYDFDTNEIQVPRTFMSGA